MYDWFLAAAFFSMVLSPCFVALYVTLREDMTPAGARIFTPAGARIFKTAVRRRIAKL